MSPSEAQSAQVVTLSRYFRVAPFDGSIFITTIAFILILAFFAIRATLAVFDSGQPDVFDLGAGILLAVLIAFGWARSVKGYRLTQEEMVVERAGPGKLHIPLESIRSAEPNPDPGSFVRVGFLSTQGLFGWSGRVNVRKATDMRSNYMTVYGTNPKNSVILQLEEDRSMIVTPADIEGFVRALHEAGVGDPGAAAKTDWTKKRNFVKKKSKR